MYLLRGNHKGVDKLGVLDATKENVVFVADIVEGLESNDLAVLIATITEEQSAQLEEVSRLAVANHPVWKDKCVHIDQVVVGSPIPYPRRGVMCLGKNYFEHVKEFDKDDQVKREEIVDPIYFLKLADPTVATEGEICFSRTETEQVDYEVELAVIIGKEAKDVPREAVKDHIFGYTIANDVSARDLQVKNKQWARAKSQDTFCPLGPYVMTADEVAYPPNLRIQSFVNDELRQDAYTNEMMFDIDYIVSDLSHGMTLKPGDIILTGTPSGVGIGFNPPKCLQHGDKVVCKIEKIGTLVNKVREY